MRSIKLLVVAVLVVMLAVSAPQHVFAATWLYYDDGDPNTLSAVPAGNQVAVKFSLQSGWSGAKLLTARYYLGGRNVFGVHVYDASWTELTPTGITTTPPFGFSQGWGSPSPATSTCPLNGHSLNSPPRPSALMNRTSRDTAMSII